MQMGFYSNVTRALPILGHTFPSKHILCPTGSEDKDGWRGRDVRAPWLPGPPSLTRLARLESQRWNLTVAHQ